MKKSRIIAPAAAILVFSSAAAVTGTVAWFTASNLVSVEGMYMKAAAENGIVIAPETDVAKVATDWKTSAVAKYSGEGAEFYPTSTKDKSAWYHGSSQKQDDGQYAVAYDQITITDNFAAGDPEGATEAAGTANDDIYGYRAEDKTFRNVYLLNKFYIQASATADLGSNDRDIYIRDFKVVVKDSDPAAGSNQALNKSLRMLVTYKKYGDASATFSKIIAPIQGATEKYYVNKSFAD
ncbi:MAG: hypothetical protein J6X03_00590, partial [Bacilli bacterium]|nr:hypothetical protein [Bacilli bacterium]